MTRIPSCRSCRPHSRRRFATAGGLWVAAISAAVMVTATVCAEQPPTPERPPEKTQNVAVRVEANSPAPSAMADVLYGALILATRRDDPRPAEMPVELQPLAKQLGVFGYNEFRLLGEKQAAVPTGTEDWLVPSRQFFLRVDTKTRLPEGDGYQLGLQLFQHDRPLPTVDCRLRRDRPLFIRGPMVGAGQLIILLRVM